MFLNHSILPNFPLIFWVWWNTWRQNFRTRLKCLCDEQKIVHSRMPHHSKIWNEYAVLQKTIIEGMVLYCHIVTKFRFKATAKGQITLNNRPCQLILNFGSPPRAAEAEVHGFQCRLDFCSENLGLNNDLLRNTIGFQMGKYF